jgi:integrase/recombinase XerD
VPEVDLAVALRSYLDHLAVERGLAANTLSSYRRDLDRYLTVLTQHSVADVGEVTQQHVADFLVRMRSGDAEHPPLAASSAARAVIAVRGFHKFALREGLTAIDPARPVRPPRTPQRLPKAIPVGEVAALIEAAGRGLRPDLALRDVALVEMLYGSGARISEAVGLDLDAVDLDSRTVLLSGKGGKQRLVPFGSCARAAVEAYLVRARPGLAEQDTETAAAGLVVRQRRSARHCSSTPGAVGCRGRARGLYCTPPRRARASTRRSRHTRCGTPSPPICSKVVPTSGSSRNFSDTPRWRPRRSTPRSASSICARST